MSFLESEQTAEPENTEPLKYRQLKWLIVLALVGLSYYITFDKKDIKDIFYTNPFTLLGRLIVPTVWAIFAGLCALISSRFTTKWHFVFVGAWILFIALALVMAPIFIK